MIRSLSLARLSPKVPLQVLSEWLELAAALPDRISAVQALTLGPNLLGSSWDYVWSMDYADPAGLQAYRDHPYHRGTLGDKFRTSGKHMFEKVEIVYYDTLRTVTHSRTMPIQHPIWNILVAKLSDMASHEHIAEFEAVITELPRRIPAIKNWCLAPTIELVEGREAWSYVFEYECQNDEGSDTYDTNKDLASIRNQWLDKLGYLEACTKASCKPAASTLYEIR